MYSTSFTPAHHFPARLPVLKGHTSSPYPGPLGGTKPSSLGPGHWVEQLLPGSSRPVCDGQQHCDTRPGETGLRAAPCKRGGLKGPATGPAGATVLHCHSPEITQRLQTVRFLGLEVSESLRLTGARRRRKHSLGLGGGNTMGERSSRATFQWL